MQLPNYSTARVLVVGDLMLDRYWHGPTSRISPEAPVPVVHVKQDEQRAGGAGNVALNIAALGAKVSLLGFTGEDQAAVALEDILKKAGVLCLFQPVPNFPTITKLRVMSRHQQLIRLDFEDGFQQIDSAPLLHLYHAEMMQSQVVVLSDYGKGTLNQVQQFIALAKQLKKPVLVDPKGSDFTVYKQATLITPNLSEFEAVVGRCADQQQIVERGTKLLAELELEALLVTRGEQGMTLLSKNQEPLHLPTHAREVFDVTGAGDTVISVLAASLAAKKPLAEATELANIGAGIVVGKMGTATVNTDELAAALQGPRAHHKGVCTLPELLIERAAAKQNGEKIVATNGCFDILHPGHVRYLQQAKTLGDRLVVLVNSDASVQRLKGPERPVNKLDHRMEMLAALECVDWVVPFEEDTPKEVIDQLLPDILVKGGDYTDITSIAGHDSVLANGGEVKILSFIEGHSTTGIIRAIKDKTQA
ncbi:bifunctional D-glycero-beta-D-manno-heptose-7-phosphate kinase/D-glycero-beta-D-manno-heptose 1-phosphate adenylyltransferase HldE [Methylomonas montana]|uniref:bifunctional D-glycero-beta-D-manno-heptose-7-phosphate kinase/D-glycero-beta-D-manno-heptose 1-phosphate adenylyltransferase HldE n=1 Tax=Methylomonas montana TaxID=3058963 RepID=UPI00265AD278|nr:bifunctional D-glycero-beta-D-manno-heptose-7-phosphate kinase/D-glycero-beta-D-manno-heptose 1-phosphate adenylyltransferase HldE [Methylomonas montana]WKJ90597.1 bifunctional D-glycero-beta-D-manno-heptose-7-phosphate kinase/D-glycero-beta-D-manno-heptose 1-phosphate adenylyltransferase HldE [Methylomonas montana]